MVQKLSVKVKKGVTLVEIIISLAILCIIIVPISSLLITSTSISKQSNEKILATSLAQSCVEYIKGSSEINYSEIGLEKCEEVEDFGEVAEGFELYKVVSEGIYKNNNDYKNMFVKIKFRTDENDENEYNDLNKYDFFIDINEKNEIIIKNENQIFVNKSEKFTIEGENPKIVLINEGSNIKYKISQGKNLCEGIINKTKHEFKDGKIKIIFRSKEAIKIDIEAQNLNDEKFKINFLNIDGSKYVYEMPAAYNITTRYDNYNFVNKNKISKKYDVDVEVWRYDKIKNDKCLLQKIKTYKVL